MATDVSDTPLLRSRDSSSCAKHIRVSACSKPVSGLRKHVHTPLQLALEPLWRAYEACEPGADVRGILGRMLKGLSLTQVRFPGCLQLLSGA